VDLSRRVERSERSISDVTVIRVGTQVVVRFSGEVGDGLAERLDAALVEIDDLVLTRVVIDCGTAAAISGAGLRFLDAARARWRVRLLDPPPEILAR
jgi:anti-anti-sigma regulatory factor